MVFISYAQESVPSLFKKIKQAVVSITIYNDKEEILGQGSGFFIDEKGKILTNRHVLQGANRVEAKTASGKIYPVKGVIAEDAEADLILIVLDISEQIFPYLRLTEVLPEEGEKILVVGSPLGLEYTISDGIVSSVRDIPDFGNIFQITAPVSPGSSGSPVINMKGEVVGVVTLQLVEGQNLNFAIPSKKALKLKSKEVQTLSQWSSTVLENWSSSSEGLTYIGLILVGAGDYEKALSYFKEAAIENSKFALAILLMGYCNSELGHYQEAINDYNEVIKLYPEKLYPKIKLYPELASAYAGRGFAYGQLDEYPKALNDFTKALELDPKYTKAYAFRGAVYGELGEYKKAINDYNEAIELDPKFATVYYTRGAAYLNLGKYQKAIDDFTKSIDQNPEDANAYLSRGVAYVLLDLTFTACGDAYQAGLLYLKQENIPEALECIDFIKKIDPSSPLIKQLMDKIYAEPKETLTTQQKEAWEWIGKANQINTPELKIEYLTKAIELSPEDALTYYNRGTAYFNLVEFQKAIDDFTKAIELSPNDTNAYLSRGVVYIVFEEHQKAIDDFANIIKLNPKDAQAYHNRGYAYDGLDEYQKAIDDYTKAIELKPNFAEAYSNRGLAYTKKGNYTQAIADHTIAIELDHNYADAYFYRGCAWEKKNLRTTACDDFYQAGLLYLKENNKTQALVCVDIIKKGDPSSPLIKKLQDKIYEESKKKK